MNKTKGNASHRLARHRRAYGFAAGADYRVAPGTVVGFALAGGGTNWSLAGGLGTGNSDAFQAGVYGSHRSARPISPPRWPMPGTTSAPTVR